MKPSIDFVNGWEKGVLQNAVDKCHCNPYGDVRLGIVNSDTTPYSDDSLLAVWTKGFSTWTRESIVVSPNQLMSPVSRT